MVATERRKWLALALLSAVQFMVVLDIAIVNVALPSIKIDLGFSQENLQWVISAYALFFGGFLLLGGRAADLLGRRRLFLAGIVLFTLSSLLAGLAWSEASLIAARSFQGLGAAVISPAALSILSTTFTEGRERNIALGVWGAVGGFGAAAGVLLGGVLTETLSWSWIFFVNVPVGVAAFFLAPRLLDESRDTTVKSFDALGAVLGANDRRHRGGGRAAGRVRLVGAPTRRAADALRDPPHEDGRGRKRRRADPRDGHVLALPDADPVHAAGARLLTHEDRRRLPRSRRQRDPLVGGRGAAREPHRRQASTRHRDGRADKRARVLHAGPRPRRVSQRPAAGLPARRRRPRLLVRADLDRCARRGPPRRGWACVRSVQHDAADRRCARHRGAVDDRDVADLARARRRNRAALGARARVHRRLRRRRRHRSGRHRRGTDAHPARRARAGSGAAGARARPRGVDNSLAGGASAPPRAFDTNLWGTFPHSPTSTAT